ncbi:hypothetical protein Tco_0145117 [Tanacetum coccineum]
MAVVEVPQTLEYKGSQLNSAPVLEVENFTNWKKRFMCHIIGIEPQFENIISNGPYILMATGQRKLETQWIPEERKAANLDQQIKGPSDVKESRAIDLKLCYNTFKFKEGESLTQTFTRYKALMNELVNDGINLSKLEINTGFINRLPKKWLSFGQSLKNTNHVTDSEIASQFGKLEYEENLINSIYEAEKSKYLVSTTPLSIVFFSASIVQDFQDNLDDEEGTRSSYEYLKDLEKEYQARALLAKSKRFFKKGTQRFSSTKETNQTECHKYGKKGHFASFCWSKTLVPSYQSPFQPKLLHSSKHKPELRQTKDFEAKYNKVKANIALLSSSALAPCSSSGKNKGLIAETYDWEKQSKESASNDEWVKISIQKVHTLLEMEDNDNRKSFLDYMCIDLNYVEEQRNNLMKKHRNLVQELNTCKEQLLVVKEAKLDLLTMQHVNTEILKENQNLRNELKEITSITEAWLNSSNKVNQCISVQIPTQKRKILGIDQLIEDTSSSRPKDPMFVKYSTNNSEVSITSSNKPKLSETEDSTLSNHDTEKLIGAEPVSGSKTIKSILKSKSTFKAETLKGIIISEPSSAPARGNKSPSVSKTNSAPAGKLKNVKIEDDPPLAIVMKELNELKLQISKNKSSYFINKNSQQIKQSERGISINKEKDVNDLLRKYDKIGSSVNTPIMPPNMLGHDLNGKAINESQYRGMIGPLMSLTASRPNIQLSTALCTTSSKYKESHLISVKNF